MKFKSYKEKKTQQKKKADKITNITFSYTDGIYMGTPPETNPLQKKISRQSTLKKRYSWAHIKK